MTIYGTLLSKGYFPKELPPGFFTEQFSTFARTKAGRSVLDKYKTADNLTECVRHDLPLPGGHRRGLAIPHPASFSRLAKVVAKGLSRLLKKTARSRFSRSRPVYAPDRDRAVSPSFLFVNLSREKLLARAGAQYLLKADINQFYPSLYTHAVGWAIDPSLRQRKHWKNPNSKLLGKRIDQELMNLQGKESQGLPIGNDISFLLAEAVLAEVDSRLKIPGSRCYRWYDDYEIACDSRRQAEEALRELTEALQAFRLRLNPSKTRIIALPLPVEDDWRREIGEAALRDIATITGMVGFFDALFRLKEANSSAPVIDHGLSALFRLTRPSPDMGRLALSGISQAVLSEPGSAQRAFALLAFWDANGFELDQTAIADLVTSSLQQHQTGGVTSDTTWGLSFCLQRKIPLPKNAARILARNFDDISAILSLRLHATGLLPVGFSTKGIEAVIKNADMDGSHWLLAYESHRQGLLALAEAKINANNLFKELLTKRVTFYRSVLPPYAEVIQPGGAPRRLVREWLQPVLSPRAPAMQPDEGEGVAEGRGVLRDLLSDAAKKTAQGQSVAELVRLLLDRFEPEFFASLLGDQPDFYGA